jgi:hypothetical protein
MVKKEPVQALFFYCLFSDRQRIAPGKVPPAGDGQTGREGE